MLQLNQHGIEVQLNQEWRYTNYNGDEMIASKYYVIYWLPNESANGKKKQIKLHFSKQIDVLEHLQDKLEEIEHGKG